MSKWLKRKSSSNLEEKLKSPYDKHKEELLSLI